MMKYAWLKEIKAIGWDIDGTLYPPHSIPSEFVDGVVLEALREKHNWTLTEAEENYRNAYDRLASKTAAITELGLDGVDFFLKFWAELPIEKYIKPDQRLQAMFESFGFIEHFILSNSNDVPQIEKKLGALGLTLDYFSLVIPTVEIGYLKPNPEPFLIALERLNMAPEEVLYVGDREETDVAGARGVGMKTCLVWKEHSQADATLTDVYQVIDLFKERNTHG